MVFLFNNMAKEFCGTCPNAFDPSPDLLSSGPKARWIVEEPGNDLDVANERDWNYIYLNRS